VREAQVEIDAVVPAAALLLFCQYGDRGGVIAGIEGLLGLEDGLGFGIGLGRRA